MSFDPLARHYRWMEFLLAGNVLQRCRTGFIDRTSCADSALLLGEGNGRFLLPFLQFNKNARVTCVEQSGRMIDRARQALTRSGLPAGRVTFIQANVLNWQPPPNQFDLIASHFFLDCFTENQLQTLIPRLASSGQKDCLWLFADFQVPADHPFFRLRARIILKTMYIFFRATTRIPAKELVEPDPFLRQCSFHLADRATAQWGLLRSDCWIRAAAYGANRSDSSGAISFDRP